MPGTIWRRDTLPFYTSVVCFPFLRPTTTSGFFIPPPLPLAEISNYETFADVLHATTTGMESVVRVLISSRCVGGATRRSIDSVIYDSVAALYLSLFNGPSILRFFVRTAILFTPGFAHSILCFWHSAFSRLPGDRLFPLLRMDWELEEILLVSSSEAGLDGILGFGRFRVSRSEERSRRWVMEVKLLMKFYFSYVFVMHRLWTKSKWDDSKFYYKL